MSHAARLTLPGLLVAGLVAIPGCGSDDEGPNQPPVITITAGPMEGSEVHYQIPVRWTATDTDGAIDHYEYIVDPPPAFTESEIARGGPGVSIQVIPGDDENPAVTRVSKIENGQTVSFDWVHTRARVKLFKFSATEPDSAGEDTLRAPTGRFTGMHALYVRAIDDDNAFSAPDKVAFTATTLAPTSKVTRPEIGDFIHYLAANITLIWSGEDLDGADPARFLYKLVRLDTLDPSVLISQLLDPYEIYELEGDWVTWEDLTQTFDLHSDGKYVFAVRAVDEAGATEPFLEWGRNAFRFQTWLGHSPELTIFEESMNQLYPEVYEFRGTWPPEPEDIEVPVGYPLQFSWEARAERYGQSYGSTIWGYSWGIDVSDVGADGPEGGWSAWGATLTRPGSPIIFQSGGAHVLYVRARDSAGGTTMGSVRINSIDFPFDREVLFVDDSFDDLKPRDNEHDAFWRARLDDYGVIHEGEISEFDAHLDNDRGSLVPQVPSLRELSRYKLVIWETRGSGYNGNTALLHSVGTGATLQNYLRAGGKLWLGGRMTVAATTPSSIETVANLIYPKDLHPGMFAWDFLKIRSVVENDKANDQSGRHNIARVRPYPGQDEIYPEMEVDVDKQNLAAKLRGVSHADALWDPELTPEDPDFRGIIEPLYVYGSTGQDLLDPPKESDYHGKLTALRWHDPDPAREHGRIQWFGFPLYYFEDTQAQETFNRSMDWFREESLPGALKE